MLGVRQDRTCFLLFFLTSNLRHLTSALCDCAGYKWREKILRTLASGLATASAISAAAVTARTAFDGLADALDGDFAEHLFDRAADRRQYAAQDALDVDADAALRVRRLPVQREDVLPLDGEIHVA